MSETMTPRTDSFYLQWDGQDLSELVEHGRRLERELNAWIVGAHAEQDRAVRCEDGRHPQASASPSATPRTDEIIRRASECPETRVLFLIHQLANLAKDLERKLDKVLGDPPQIKSTAALAAPDSTPQEYSPKVDDGWCQTCKGSGSGRAMTRHLGPDDYEVEVECPDCKGTGADPAPSEKLPSRFQLGHAARVRGLHGSVTGICFRVGRVFYEIGGVMHPSADVVEPLCIAGEMKQHD